MSQEVKIVIALKDHKGSIGLQSPDCDPIFATFEGNLEHGLGMLPGLLEEANHRWDQNPRYPKCKSPLPSQTTSTTQTSSVSRPAAQRQRTADRQQAMF